MDPVLRWISFLVFLTFCFSSVFTEAQTKDAPVTIESVSVESQGLNQPAYASVLVKTPQRMPVYTYWSDITTWLPAQGHPNYTITEQAWIEDKNIYLKSTIRVKSMLLSQLNYYYDYDKEHLFYYLPMSADVRSGDGSLIYHHTFDIPEKTAYQNFTSTKFSIIHRPRPVVHYTTGEKVMLQWRFYSSDENEFTMWRTLFETPTSDGNLDYADQMLYAEDFTRMYHNEVLKFDNINITKKVYKMDKQYAVSVRAIIDPAGDEDEALYVLFVKSKHLLSWDKALNLRLSTRLLRKNVTSLLHGKVALTLSYCDGDDVVITNGTGYVALNRSQENCVKCEAYGSQARQLIYTKGHYLVRPTNTNALVYSQYYPETRSIMYTFRSQAEKAGSDTGEYFCRAILKSNKVVSRRFHVAWTEPVTLEAEIVYVNQSEAQMRCIASADPQPTLTVWRCDGDTFCDLKSVDQHPNYDIQISSGDVITATIMAKMIPAEMKQEAILCRASNNFDEQEDWLLFDDKIRIEETEATPEEEEPVEAIGDEESLSFNDPDMEVIYPKGDANNQTLISENEGSIDGQINHSENEIATPPLEPKKASDKDANHEELSIASGDGEP